MWSAGTNTRQLLFIFPTIVNLVAITLHYYHDSDSFQGQSYSLPRLKFFAVPDDFDVWNAVTTRHRYVEVAAVPPGGESAGHRSVSINISFSTKKVLMYKFESSFNFAMSEVEFFTCSGNYLSYSYTLTQTSDPVARTTTTIPNPCTSQPASTTISFTNPAISITEAQEFTDTRLSPQSTDTESSTLSSSNHTSVREVVAWTLAAISTVLFIGSLTVNITVLWVYKKRQAKDNNVESRAYEMEGNPCYEASKWTLTHKNKKYMFMKE